MTLALDHLVIAASSLDAGAAYLAKTLGVAPAGGGKHAAMGTHNRLLGLYGGIYLEVIAIDPQATPPARPRWFGMDGEAVQRRLADGPFLAHWVARVDRPADLSTWQAQYRDQIAPVIPMVRGELRWRITVPEDGSLPGWPGEETPLAGEGVIPSLIQWDVPAHPSTMLPKQDLALRRLIATHHRPEAVRSALAWLGADGLIEVEAGDAPSLRAELETPQGIRTLR
jgi:hypothetical protein